MHLSRRELLIAILVMGLAFGAGGWLRRAQPPGTPEQAAQLRALARDGDLLMISSTTCIYCTQAREWLTAAQVPFSECFIERDVACQRRYAQTGARATPTMVVGDHAMLGLDVAQLVALLQARASAQSAR